MFSFDNNQLKANQVMEIAKHQGVSPLRVAINANGYSAARSFWNKPVERELSHLEFAFVEAGIKLAARSRGVVGLKAVQSQICRNSDEIKRAYINGDVSDKIIPALEEKNVIILIGEKVFFNPDCLTKEFKPTCSKLSEDYENWLSKQDVDELRLAMKLYRYVKNLK